MDKVVDHLLVFKGNGEIQDFPDNYTQYRQWLAMKTKSEAEKQQKKNETSTGKSAGRRDGNEDKPRKLTYKERMEMERLEKEIGQLEEEQKSIEDALCSGTLDVDSLTDKSKRLAAIKDEIDEKSMRWLELSEI